MSSPTTLAVHRELAARLEQDDLVSNISPARTCSPTRKSYMLSVRGDRSRSEQGKKIRVIILQLRISILKTVTLQITISYLLLRSTPNSRCSTYMGWRKKD